MNDDQWIEEIKGHICITTQMVTIAKSFILENFESQTESMLRYLMSYYEVCIPEQLHLSEQNIADELKKLASAISWHNAGSEALWSLVSQNILIPTSSEIRAIRAYPNYTYSRGGSSTSSSLNLERYIFPVHQEVKIRPSGIGRYDVMLSNPDMYLTKMELLYLREYVEVDLTECVTCFRNELYLASVTMLGRAMEGAWIQLGLSLAEYCNNEREKEGLVKAMNSPYQSFAKKKTLIMKAYESKDTFGVIYKNSGVSPNQLAEVRVWTDTIREARNAIHPGEDPAIPNNYEKVAVFLMGVIPQLQCMDRIAVSCNTLENG